ncbi:MAG: hypothetical protein AAF223_09765 [Bacteroidota bacterium]
MSRRAKNLQNFTRFIERRLPSRQGNLKVVVLCLIAATTFWFFSALNKEGYTTRIRYPVNITYPSDSNIYLLSELPEDVTVQVTGGGWDLLKKSLRLNTSPVEISLDTPTQTKYILGQALAEQIGNQLDNLTLDEIVTDTLRINIDSTQSRNLALAIDPQSMQLVENYRMVSDVVLSPSQIEVWGPASLIQQLPDTLQLSMENREISGEIETTLDVPTIDRHIEVFPDEVMVNLAAELYTKIERKISVAPINFPKDSTLYLSQDFVTVSFWLLDDLISPALMNQLNFQAQADLQTLNQEDSTVVVKLVDIPAIVSDVHFNPSRIPVNYAP